jgi:putative hemolysin
MGQVKMNKTLLSQRSVYPKFLDQIPADEVSSGNYLLRFARTPEDLDAILKLRFDIFNLELGEGLEASYHTRRDEDEFDVSCHHLMVVEATTGTVVGTYRMQTFNMAMSARGFYSNTEFDLSSLPAGFLDQAVELGRACVDKDHRNGRVLFLLWKGLMVYMKRNHRRYFFGCCSLTSQDPAEGKRVMAHLEQKEMVHPVFRVQPQPGFECYRPDFDPPPGPDAKIPKLMRLYLEYGARICGPPAIDRIFKTIDYLAVFDLETISARARKMFLD